MSTTELITLFAIVFVVFSAVVVVGYRAFTRFMRLDEERARRFRDLQRGGRPPHDDSGD